MSAVPVRTASVVDAARDYIARGWQVVPLVRGTKKATEGGWPRLIFKPEDFGPEDNIGIRSVNGLVVTDLDSPEAVALADAFLPETHAVWGRASKLRSKRLYLAPFKKTIPLKDDERKSIVELRANHQDAAPPSVHPEGEQLEWAEYGEPSRQEAESLLRSHRLLATAVMVARHYGSPGARHEWCLALAGFLRALDLAEDETTRVVRAAAGHAGDTRIDDRLTEIRSTYGRSDDEPITGAKELAESSGKNVVEAIKKIWGASAGHDHLGFAVNDSGHKLGTPRNIRLALDKLGAELAFDGFANKPQVTYEGNTTFLGDAVRNRLWLAIDERFNFLPPQPVFDIVLQDAAQQHAFHPVCDYLASLTWDSTPRIDKWLVTYGEAADNRYVRAVGALVLIAAVRRVRKPGCKFDEMLVLESTVQGRLKSTALQALCRNHNWFSDDLPLHIEAKQIIERTAGKWIIEAADLSGMNKTRIEHLKSMLSRQVDGPVRLAYAHLPDQVPRQFVIIGTTNSHKYLKDATGNRRFWPVRVERFDTEALVRDRDQLWAEAAQREEKGESIRLDPSLWPLAELQQERRRLDDPWEEVLAPLFEDSTKEYRVLADDLWNRLQISADRRTEKDAERLAAVMESFGFEHRKARSVSADAVKRGTAYGAVDTKTVKRWCRTPQGYAEQGTLNHE
jgi:predicted P-loop ATPase